MVSGDFVLTSHVSVTNRLQTDIPGSSYSLGGLMVRNPKALTNGSEGWNWGEENYVFLSLGRAANNHPSCMGCPPPHFEVKSTVNSNSTLAISSIDTTAADFRLVRLDPYVLVLFRFPGMSWEVHRRYYRPDLADTVQVGMVTYTDWDKASTYETTFHNSHVLNEDLDPDPSNNPGLAFAPDIITRYDFLEWRPDTMPSEWEGLNLLDENVVTDQDILDVFGPVIPIPQSPGGVVWLGRISSDWGDPLNWLSGVIPAAQDIVRVNSCACSEASCLTVSGGATTIGGLMVGEGAVVTIAAGDTLQVTGAFANEGELIVHGVLEIVTGGAGEAMNRGIIDCRAGGLVRILE
jgi:hypothetical protein